MSIDTLGFRAAHELLDATKDLDVEQVLRKVESPSRSRNRSTLLVAACLVLALAAGWLGTRFVLGDEQSAPPLDEAPPQVVGGQLSVPVQLTAPDGWQVVTDGATVELASSDGSDSTITVVGQPVKVYQPANGRLAPLREDLVVWTTTHPDLAVSDRFGLDGPGFAWTGTEMTLALREGAGDVPLVPLPGRTEPLAITVADLTFHWDVIYLTDSPPLVVASRSGRPDDVALNAAREELLQSLQVTSATE